MFAIVEIGGKQFKVSKGTQIEVEKMTAKEGSIVSLEKVLLMEISGQLEIGKPFIEGMVVDLKVLGDKKGDKVKVYKMKAKKRYQKTQGHRQKYSFVEVVDIKKGSATKKEKAADAPKEAEKKAPAKKTTSAAKKTTKTKKAK